MTPEQFCYWLQGYTEIHGQYPTSQQWQVIKDHLQEVFHKVTPDYAQKDPFRKLVPQQGFPIPGITPSYTPVELTPSWPKQSQIIC